MLERNDHNFLILKFVSFFLKEKENVLVKLK